MTQSLAVRLLLVVFSFVVCINAGDVAKLSVSRVTPDTTEVYITGTTLPSEMSVFDGDKYTLQVEGSGFTMTSAREAREIKTWGGSSSSTYRDYYSVKVKDNRIEHGITISDEIPRQFYTAISVHLTAKVSKITNSDTTVRFTYTNVNGNSGSVSVPVPIYPSLAKKAKLDIHFDQPGEFRASPFTFSTSALNHDLPKGFTVILPAGYSWTNPPDKCKNNGVPVTATRDKERQKLIVSTPVGKGQSVKLQCEGMYVYSDNSFFDSDSLFAVEASIDSDTAVAVYDGKIPAEFGGDDGWVPPAWLIVLIVGVVVLAGVVGYRLYVSRRARKNTGTPSPYTSLV